MLANSGVSSVCKIINILKTELNKGISYKLKIIIIMHL